MTPIIRNHSSLASPRLPWRATRFVRSLAARRARASRPLIGALLLLLAGGAPALASTSYGDLNNFDVFNDTGQLCHGFEIELEDIHSTDITYTYDWNHYGAPTITEDNSNPAHPKVTVRYAAKYNGSFSAYTAMPATPPAATNGHMCTNPAVNFGCEHFGVGHYGSPGVIRYHWLIEDPAAPGTLIRGPAVNVATPSWTYFPPAPGQPVAEVQAVILAPPPPPAPVYEFGDAEWVKAIVTTSHNAEVVELKELISDDPDDPNDVNWKNNEPDEVETEWYLLQTEFSNPDAANNDLAGGNEALPDGDEVITRRYEFYKYTGPLDPESNEATCDNYPQIADPNDPKYKADCDPAVTTVLGDYIGAQMAGFNVEAVLGLIDHVEDGNLNDPYTARTVVVGGNTPYVTEISTGALPAGLNIDSATGVLSGAPLAAGAYSFTVSVTDADLVQQSKAYTLTVAGPPGSCDGVVCVALDACHDVGTCDPATGICTDPAKADNTPCDDGDACTTGDVCVIGFCAGVDTSAVDCDDTNACTTDTCEAATGCVHTDNSNPCDDGNVCTVADTCAAGTCVGDPNHCGDGVVQAACAELCDDGGNPAASGCSSTCQLEAAGSDCLRSIGSESRKLAGKELALRQACLDHVVDNELACIASQCVLKPASKSPVTLAGSTCTEARDCCPDFDSAKEGKSTDARLSEVADKAAKGILGDCSLDSGPDKAKGTDDDTYVAPQTLGFATTCLDVSGECGGINTTTLNSPGGANDLVDCVKCAAAAMAAETLDSAYPLAGATADEMHCQEAIGVNARKAGAKDLTLWQRCEDEVADGNLACEAGKCVLNPGSTRASIVGASTCVAAADCCPNFDNANAAKSTAADLNASDAKVAKAIKKACSTAAGADEAVATDDDVYVAPAALGFETSCQDVFGDCSAMVTTTMVASGSSNDLVDCLACTMSSAAERFTAYFGPQHP